MGRRNTLECEGVGLQHPLIVAALFLSFYLRYQTAIRAFKRLIDIAGGTIGLLLSVPVIGIFGTIVYPESPGAIFYRQRRSGRYHKPFDIIKIRSMRLDAERNGRLGWTVQKDPARLRIGVFMRK